MGMLGQFQRPDEGGGDDPVVPAPPPAVSCAASALVPPMVPPEPSEPAAPVPPEPGTPAGPVAGLSVLTIPIWPFAHPAIARTVMKPRMRKRSVRRCEGACMIPCDMHVADRLDPLIAPTADENRAVGIGGIRAFP